MLRACSSIVRLNARSRVTGAGALLLQPSRSGAEPTRCTGQPASPAAGERANRCAAGKQPREVI
jgi:hypothetical protein